MIPSMTPVAHRDGFRAPPREVGRAREPGAVVREQRLVGRDHVMARADRAFDDRLGDALGAADQLDHHVDSRIGRHGGSVVEPRQAGNLDRARLASVARGHARDRDRAPAARRDQRAVLVDQADRLRPDGAQAGDRDLQGFAHQAGFRTRPASAKT